MKIYLDNIIFSLQKAGGISAVWKELIEHTKGYEDLDLRFLEYEGSTYNIFRRDLSIPSKDIILRKRNLLRIKRYLNPSVETKEPFVFHSSYFRICSNKYAKNISTVHDFTYEYFMKGLQQKVHTWQKNRALRNSDIVVCISENTKKDLLRFMSGIDESKIRVIYNGVSEDYKQVETHRWDYLGDYIVFVGSRQPYKQFQFTVEAVKDTPYKLAIVGGKLSEAEVAFLDDTIGKDKYIYAGFLSNEELNLLYNQAVCLAYPSAYEGFGIPVLEAQRAGCPVLAYNASSIPEVIGETPLLLNCLTIKEFHDKLSLLKKDSVRKEVVSSGLANSQRFSWKKMGEEYVELYKELLT